MNKDPEMCELCRMEDGDPLYNLVRILSARGIHAFIRSRTRGWRSPSGGRTSSLMVRCGELVYARWVAAAVGVDTWPDR